MFENKLKDFKKAVFWFLVVLAGQIWLFTIDWKIALAFFIINTGTYNCVRLEFKMLK